MSGRGVPVRGGPSARAPLGPAVVRSVAQPAVKSGGPTMNPDGTYRAKFVINGRDCSLDCKVEDRFENIKERIWKSLSLVDEKKDQYLFKTKKFDRYFKDFETFARLLAVFQEEDNPRIEALLIKKDQVDPEAERLDVRLKDDGSVPIQGYMDRLSHIASSASTERRYFVLKESTLFFYASEAAFYQKEQAVGSLDLGHCQALKVPSLKRTFQLIRMEDAGATGKYVFRAEDETAFKLWLHHLRRMNYQLTKQRGLAASVWVPDKSVDACMHCDKPFSITRRKHHCRTCGAVICGDCSPEKLTIADGEESIRVCKHCRKDYKRELLGKKKKDFKKEVGLHPEEEEGKEKKEKDEFKELRREVRSSIKLSAGVEGYLDKQSARGLKPWQKRWCVLDEKSQKISYYKDRKERLGGAIGEIKVNTILQCCHIPDDRCRFDIVTARKTYAFMAPSPALSSRWVTHINKLLRGMSKDGEEVAAPAAAAPVRRLKGAPEPDVKAKEKPKTNIFLEGPLKKMSPKRLFAAFQDRWFILDQSKGQVNYYKRSPKEFPGEELLGSIPFTDIAMCKTDFTDRSKPKFSIWVHTGRQYTLLCRTEAEGTQWVTSITKCVGNLQDVAPTPATPHGSSRPTGRASEMPPPRVGGYVEADDEEDVPPPPPPPPGGFADALPAGKVGWPQLAKLSPRELIPVTLRMMSFLPERDVRSACQVSRFWKVVAEEVLQFEDEGDESDVGEAPGEDSGSGDEESKVKAIVIDNGSYWIRAGFAGDSKPRVVIPQTSAGVLDPAEAKAEAVSLDAMNHFQDTKATWKAMEKCWKQVFEKLGVDPSEYKILITQPTFSPNFVKQNYMQILFKKFKAQAVYVTDSPVLTAYSYGKYTGMVVEVGNTSVQVCAIVEGYMKENVTKRAPYLGGEASTQRLWEFLKYTPLSKINFHEALKIANKIKEQYCFVPKDFNAAQKDPRNKVNYKLPTGEEITIQRALPSIGEMYFDPKKAIGDRDEVILSLQEMIRDAAEASDLDTRKDLLENILISGGESMMPGFIERLDLEIRKLMPHAASYIKIHADKDRNNCVFNGGAILAGLDMFQKNWVMPWDWAADQPGPPSREAPPKPSSSISASPQGGGGGSAASRAKSPARASSPRR